MKYPSLVGGIGGWSTRAFALAAVVSLACNGDDGGRDEAGDAGTVAGTTTGSDTDSMTASNSTTASNSMSGTDSTDTTGSNSDSESQSESGESTSSVDTTSGTTTGETTTDGVTVSDTDMTSDTSTTTGPNCDEMMNGGDALSLIWIANSSQGTVSKIDTQTGIELGRYLTRPDGGGSPSRTSVNRYGDVAVANRQGGVTKVIAREERCIDKNNDGQITTSTGAGDILAWGEDECIAWHTPVPHGDNRPIAWTGGTFNEDTCEYEGLEVWSAYSDGQLGTAAAILLNGDDGAMLAEIPMPDVPQAWPGWYGFYGGAVDADDNFWISQLQGGWLARVNHSDFSYDHWDAPGPNGGYGMTVTSEGYVWLCGTTTHRFNPETQAWTSVPLLNGGVHTGGCMGDGDGILYRGSYAQIHGIDTVTLEVVKTLDVGQQGDDHIWGVAVDFDGKVWGVPRNGTRAYKVNPDTGVIEILFQGLVGAYTYSDMTGFALFNVNPA